MSKYTKHQDEIYEYVWAENHTWKEAAEKFQTSVYYVKRRLMNALYKNEVGR